MMRAMRQIVKPVFWILGISFVGWLAYGQVTEYIGGAKDVVLQVDHDIVRSQRFQQQYQAALEQYRRQQGGGRLSREDEQQVQDQVADQMIQNLLLERAYQRLGITVSDEEVAQAARSSPPPQVLQQVLRDPTFQTNGQFDITKWQRYLASADPEFRLQIETLYREYLPEQKLQQYLTADLYVSDAKLWRIWRDQHESVAGAMLAVGPEDIPDSLAPVSDADVQRYYGTHGSDFKQPATAWLSYVVIPRVPDAADSAVALARVRRVRAELAGTAKFADVAKRESADSGSASQGGDLGWVKRDASGFVAPFAAALRRLGPGELSQPVLTPFGYHLIRVEAVRGDSVHARHILIPIALQGKHLDAVDARTDTLDRLAAEQTDGSRLDSVARPLGLPLTHGVRLDQGRRLTLAGDQVPDVGVWAFEGRLGETSPVIEGTRGSYVFRVDSLVPAGVPPLTAIRARVVAAARYEKKKAVARARAEQLAAALRDARDLLAAGRARGLPVRKVGPFTRVTPPPELARNPIVLGAAFGLRPGERTGLIADETGFFLLQGLTRTAADSAAWLKQRDQQREALLRPVAQARIQQFLAALRAQAKVVDHRKELYRPATASQS
ncbi:MAG TPA: peptidyl-prolyl cis-trans isomerase [Gemmatimonadales bacterium]|nr:peptidyl-prolyl cis-trans isomerase [Gemmatimonadales bacterium]